MISIREFQHSFYWKGLTGSVAHAYWITFFNVIRWNEVIQYTETSSSLMLSLMLFFLLYWKCWPTERYWLIFTMTFLTNRSKTKLFLFRSRIPSNFLLLRISMIYFVYPGGCDILETIQINRPSYQTSGHCFPLLFVWNHVGMC